MSSTSSDQPAEKLQKKEDRKLASDMAADDSTVIIELYAGPTVTVFVQDKEFTLPKRLLCHCSPFFDRSFNGNFQEAQNQSVTLESATIDSFELAIKWMYHGNLVLPSRWTKDEDIITQFVAFAKLADFLGLIGSFVPPADQVKSIIVQNRTALSTKHIRDAMTLPTDNALRVMILKACVKPYIESLRATSIEEFEYHKLLSENDVFAAGLFKLYDEAIRNTSKTFHSVSQIKRLISSCNYCDPLSGESLQLLWMQG